MPRAPLTEIQPTRLALIKPSALGDIVHALPVLHALRHRFPAASITWIVNRSYASLLRGNPSLNGLIEFDRHRVRSWPHFALSLRRMRFDLVIDLQGLLRTGLMTWATGAPRRVGLSSAREGSRFAYTDLIHDDRDLHAVDRYWRVAQAVGVGAAEKRFDLARDSAAESWADGEFSSMPRPWHVVSLGSRWETKRWPVPHFVSLLMRATDQFGGSVIFVGAPNEATLAQQAMLTLTCPVKDLAGKTTLAQLVSILRRADVVLANDSGPLHLAAALGRPVVAPYTCTQVRRHGPYGQAGGVETQVACHGSYLKRCARLDCFRELTSDRLWPTLAEKLHSWARLSRSA